MGCVEACALQPATAQVESTQIGLAKVAVRKVGVRDVYLAQIEAAEIAAAQIALLAGLLATIEFLAASFAQQQVERIGWFTGVNVRHEYSIGGAPPVFHPFTR